MKREYKYSIFVISLGGLLWAITDIKFIPYWAYKFIFYLPQYLYNEMILRMLLNFWLGGLFGLITPGIFKKIMEVVDHE